MPSNPQYTIDQGLLAQNRKAAEAHKTEDFFVGEHVYVWKGTYAGTTTAVVVEAKAGEPAVLVSFEDDNLPQHLQGAVVPIVPSELMHEGEHKTE